MRSADFNLAEELLAELVALTQTLAPFSDVEGVMRLRALTELAEQMDTDALCRLVSDLAGTPVEPHLPCAVRTPRLLRRAS